jgi:hypothetical protein
VKKPVLVGAAFLLGFLPTYILYRSRLWSLRRRLDPLDRTIVVPPAPVRSGPPPAEVPVETVADEDIRPS